MPPVPQCPNRNTQVLGGFIVPHEIHLLLLQSDGLAMPLSASRLKVHEYHWITQLSAGTFADMATTELGAAYTGVQIKQLRAEQGLELKDMQGLLARHLGRELGLSTLSRMETGKGRGPTIEELLAFAVILKTTPNRLIFGPGGRQVDEDGWIAEGAPIQVTREVASTDGAVWLWAAAEGPIVYSDEALDSDFTALWSEVQDFKRRNRLNNPPTSTPVGLIWEVERTQADVIEKTLEGFLRLKQEGLQIADIMDLIKHRLLGRGPSKKNSTAELSGDHDGQH